ncbi:MAG TPA: hypothetical protein VFK05_15365 [Polyangiaceae bacterium]|nr:hypothetical protein [Polyangiaceae bacterium]
MRSEHARRPSSEPFRPASTLGTGENRLSRHERWATTPRTKSSLAQQLFVLLPTLAVSALLGQIGLPLLPRMAASLGFGAVLIAGLAYRRR